MDNSSLLVVAMAEQCSALIKESKNINSGLPQAVHPKHLLWMCDRIRTNADSWSATTLHRWIGFIQCGMLANDMLDFAGTKSMFDDAKNAFGVDGDDDDLIDHLNPDASFELDIGGQG